MSTRFYCPDPPADGRYRLVGDEARHLVKVCRHEVGDRVQLFDGRGLAITARVVAIGKDRVELVPEADSGRSGQPRIEALIGLTLATAVPKGDRFDWLVEKATELGVFRLIPLITERSVVDPRGTKLDRLRRTVVEAAKQCGRNRLMSLDPPTRWDEMLRSAHASIKFLADPEGHLPSLWPRIGTGVDVLLAVGPEGGLTGAERDQAIGLGWIPIRFSVNVLRIETAAIAGAASILSRWE